MTREEFMFDMSILFDPDSTTEERFIANKKVIARDEAMRSRMEELESACESDYFAGCEAGYDACKIIHGLDKP